MTPARKGDLVVIPICSRATYLGPQGTTERTSFEVHTVTSVNLDGRVTSTISPDGIRISARKSPNGIGECYVVRNVDATAAMDAIRNADYWNTRFDSLDEVREFLTPFRVAVAS
jgi:hypothetical protein